MKVIITTLSILVCSYLCKSFNYISHELNKSRSVCTSATTIKGDFNGDGVQEEAWIVPPKFTSDSMGCVGKCISLIKFSNKHIPPIVVNGCIGGDPTNLGDLNNNGSDEIGLLPDWFTSCWRSYHVYTYEKGKWIDAVKPFPVHCNTAEEDLPLIKKDKAKKGM